MATKKKPPATAARSYILDDAGLLAWKDKARTDKNAGADVVIAKQSGSRVAGGKLAGPDDVRKFLASASKDVVDAAMAELSTERPMVPCIMSDMTEDRDKDIIETSGWQLDQFNKNPVMLWSHQYGVPAIGNVIGIHVDGTALKGVALFCSEEINEEGFEIGRMYEENVLRAFSVGFIPLEWTYEQDRGSYAMRYIRQELVEHSACNVGSNRNALAEARSVGIGTAGIERQLGSLLDLGGMSAVQRAEAEKTWRLLRPSKTFVDVGAVLAAAREDREKAIAAEREKATDPGEAIVVDWQGVALALGKSDAGAFDRARRGNTYAATSALDVAKMTAAQAKHAETMTALAAALDTESEDPPAPEPTEAERKAALDAAKKAQDDALARTLANARKALGLD